MLSWQTWLQLVHLDLFWQEPAAVLPATIKSQSFNHVEHGFFREEILFSPVLCGLEVHAIALGMRICICSLTNDRCMQIAESC